MPSPFPGMDPFLENPEVYPDFHASFINQLRDALQPRLPDHYYAATQVRAWLETSERPIIPDSDDRLATAYKLPKARARRSTRGGALLETPKPRRIKVPMLEVTESYVSVFAKRRGQGDQLVTSIELLSPSNKTTGTDARRLYLQKQRELLGASVHLVEIDLLRGGEHTTAVPEAYLLDTATRFDYHVRTRLFPRSDEFLIVDVLLSKPLPNVPIPLLPGDGEVMAELQKIFRRVYAAAAFEKRLDYGAIDSLKPPLRPEQRAWAAALLKRRGLLPRSQ